jgi:hypothetical protein
VVVRDGESDDFSIDFRLTPGHSEELHDASDGKDCAVRILSICNVKCDNATFDFASHESIDSVRNVGVLND